MVFRKEPGKESLKPEDCVKEERTDQTKNDEGIQILSGIHFNRSVHSGKAIDPTFNWNA
jgi:hypothetical protein